MTLFPNECVSFIVEGTIVTGDGQSQWEAPYAGEIVAVEGFIANVGTVGGQTRIQISCGATDYLTTEGDFVQASGTGLMENAVLAVNPTFDAGDIIELDIDTVPTGTDSADLHIRLWVKIAPVDGY